MTEHMTSWRASEASETLFGLNNGNLRYMLLASERSERDTIRVYKFELVRYVYIYIFLCIYIYMYGGTYVIIVAHAAHK